MKRLIWIAMLCLVAPTTAWTQVSTTDPVSYELGQVPCSHNGLVASDPVSSRLRQVFDCYSDGVIAMAEEFPVSEYTRQQILRMTVGHMVDHVAEINNYGCSKISGATTPEHEQIASEANDVRVANEADKDKLVARLKSSVEFCKRAFSNLSDAKLGESVSWDGMPGLENILGAGAKVTRLAATLEVTNNLIERYIALDVYLQMNGLPTAPTLATLD